MAPSADISDFVPVSDWPDLEALAAGYSEHLMPQSNKLSGKKFEHSFDNGYRISHYFVDDDKLTWRILDGEEHPAYKEQVSLVLDVITGQAVVGVSGFSDENGQRRTWTKFTNATANDRGSVEPYLPTEELIGKHVLYRYTPRDAYEHVYLNKGTFLWHCLSGTEKGLADAEPCKMLKLRDSLYLLFWTETIMPVESIVVVDLEAMRSTGRFFCWDPKPQRAVHMLFGSYATALAETDGTKELEKPIRR
ncbi:hypothetical protein QQX98_004469 [Neonectria punicea]|uniref:Molybdenum cofactor biosynthesis protein F n=1 Tax=Neonectria punicea TaxID=979145 RepID=A0ABR1H9U0_9HYPO